MPGRGQAPVDRGPATCRAGLAREGTMGKACCLAVVAVLAVTGYRPAMSQPAVAGEWGCGIVIMRDGDLFLAGFDGPQGCARPQREWILKGNVFSSAGQGFGTVVGMNHNYRVLAANGDEFQLAVDYNNCIGFEATFIGNVFAFTGTGAPGEEFVAFGSAYAVTTFGNVYRWEACVGWRTVSGLPTGPTASSRSSWGDLKMTYR